MAYYVRKIARAKWALLEQDAENIIENYKADTIANDMKTQGNTLSLWRVESMDKKDIDPVIVINSLLGDTISKIDLIFIPEDMIRDFALKQKDGNTVVSKYCNLHYDIVSLRFLYNGIIIKHQKTEPTYTKTSLFLCEKRRFFMARREKGVVPIIYFEKERGKSF